MGYYRHNAIIVTAYNERDIEIAHKKAIEVFRQKITDVVYSFGFGSFMIPTDGSKEGWEASDIGDAERNEFIVWLKSFETKTSDDPYMWVEVQYWDDDGDVKVVQGNC